MEDKHAYLILAHSSPNLLEKLVKALDDVRNDIFIHLDSKADYDLSSLVTSKSGLYVIEHRIDARWGDFSLVKVEIILMEAAKGAGSYGYYHIISGVDFPLKSQDYIHSFCNTHKGTLFIGFANHAPQNELKWRTQHYFLFPRDFKSKNIIKKVLRALFARVQSVVGYTRIKLEVKKGCQWCSITDAFVDYVLQNKDFIEKSFKNTYCPDEMFIQTMCWNSKFKANIFCLDDEFEGCKRYIVWENSVIQNLDHISPTTLVESDRWFGRKFSESAICQIDKIENLIYNKGVCG